jgi:hypothetical protein
VESLPGSHAQRVAGGVSRDREQPGREHRIVANRPRITHKHDEHRLRDVLGQVRIADLPLLIVVVLSIIVFAPPSRSGVT